ncbi:hypothetical protein M0R45_018299 [Rubus argutus]|uniref:Uncharacterized protein n=1 Tax=Rubus argutus TaxID=59490 RepID=A0AAW1X3C7_RUBAR
MLSKRKLTDLSDKEIMKFLKGKYFPEHNIELFVVANLFKITKTIIDHATDNSIVNNILQQVNAQIEKISMGNDRFSFVSPLCILKSIGCEMSSSCAVKVTDLTSDEEKPYQLSYLVTKIKGILEILEIQHESCKKEIEVIYNYKKLLRMMKTTRKISEAINILILSKDEKPPVISVGRSVKKEVIRGETFVNVVKENYVLFYISSLENTTTADISSLTEVHEEIQKTNKNLTTVWIPIVEDWTKNQIEKFEQWGSLMPWYKMQFFSPAVNMYLKKEWSYTGNATAVLMNPKGKLQYTNALTLIRTHEINFLDFIENKVDSLSVHVFSSMQDEKLKVWSKDERKCIFIYGGADEVSINKWQKKVDRANLSIKEYRVLADNNKKIRPDCCEFEIFGKVPKDIEYCPLCDHPAEITLVSYKCCHPGIPRN